MEIECLIIDNINEKKGNNRRHIASENFTHFYHVCDLNYQSHYLKSTG